MNPRFSVPDEWKPFVTFAAVVVCIVLVYVVRQHEMKKKQQQDKKKRRSFLQSELMIEVRHPTLKDVSLRSCASHRKNVCYECHMDFVDHNEAAKKKGILPPQWPRNERHFVLCCIPRRGIHPSCVRLIHLKSGIEIGDDDVVSSK